MKPDATMKVNSNVHRMAGADLLANPDARFMEYRRNWKEWPENFSTGGFPLFIDIEATNACNLSCPFCPTTPKREVLEKDLISPDLVARIIDEGAANGLAGVKFNIRGEPLLHPRIAEFVKHAKSAGLIDVYFNTNGMLLTEEMSERLIDASLDRISVSFEGYTKEMYEKYRVGSKYETVLANIETMQALKRRMGADRPKLRVQTVMLPEIETIKEEYKDFWKGRADEVIFLDHQETGEKRRGRKYPWACQQLWQRMAVFCDGTILPCNHDFDGLIALGNIKEISIKDAWCSDKLNRIRELHRKGAAHEIPACDNCCLRHSEIDNFLKREKGGVPK